MKKIHISIMLLLTIIAINAQTVFIENKGQIVDQNGQTNSEVLYILPLSGMNVALYADGFSYDVFEQQQEQKKMQTIRGQIMQGITNPQYPCATPLRIHRVDIRFQNAHQNVQVKTENAELASKLNYFTTGAPEQGIHDVQRFSKIIYTNVYDGIDVEFVASAEKGFEYNFVIATDADMSQIAMLYQGQNSIALENNVIQLSLSTNDLHEKIPCSYFIDNKQKVEVTYTLQNNMIQFSNLSNKINGTLVIDPTPNLIYATYFGGSGDDLINDSDLDIAGNLYIVGVTNSTSGIATTGAFQSEIVSGTSDMFISKFDSNHQLLWSTYYGGEGSDSAEKIKLCDSGFVIKGFGYQSSSLATNGAYQTIPQAPSVDLLAYFDFDGNRFWSTYYEGWISIGNIEISESEELYTIATTNNNLTVCGNNPYQNNSGGAQDGFITRWDLTTGTPEYCSYIGGTQNDALYSIICASNGNILLSGHSNSENFPVTSDAIQSNLSSNSTDAVIVIFNQEFQLLYSSYFGGEGDENANLVALMDNQIVLSGLTTYGSDLTTFDAIMPNFAGYRDCYYAIFNSDNVLEYCTLVGGSNFEYTFEAIASENFLYLIGTTSSVDNIASLGAWQEEYLDPNIDFVGDIFMRKVDMNNQIVWSTYFGNYESDNVSGIHFSNDKVFLTGNTETTDSLPSNMQQSFATSDAFHYEHGGRFDGFIAEFDNTTGIQQIDHLGDFSIYPNPTNTSFQIKTDNISFPAQLTISDISGRIVHNQIYYSSPINITNTLFSDGLYNVKLKNESASSNKKLEIVR